MKTYRYIRALDGAPVDHTRTLSAAEAAPLVASGAIVEVADELAPAPEPAPAPAEQPAPQGDIEVREEPAKPARAKKATH